MLLEASDLPVGECPNVDHLHFGRFAGFLVVPRVGADGYHRVASRTARVSHLQILRVSDVLIKGKARDRTSHRMATSLEPPVTTERRLAHDHIHHAS